MGLRFLPVLALAVCSRGLDFGDIADLLRHVHQHHEQLRTLVHARINLQYVPLHKVAPPPAEPESCDDCHKEGVKYIMAHSVEKIAEMCNEATQKDCRMAKVCGLMSMKPNVTLGMMIEHVRPFSLTAAYCTGKGVCEVPNNATMAEIELGEQPHQVLLKHFDQVDWRSELEKAQGFSVSEGDESEKLEEEETCEMPQHVCPHCMQNSMRRVMAHAVGRMREMCLNSKCPKVQRLCRVAGEHREVAFGMLLAKVEPWKFAFGHCVDQRGDGFWGIIKKITRQVQEMITV